MRSRNQAATLLTLASGTCAAVASIVTLAWKGAFPEPVSAAFNGPLAEARGWSLTTLGLALPLLVVSHVATIRGSTRGRLGWAGVLAYLVYTYLELAVSPPFTALYLLYVVAFATAIPALVFVVSTVDLAALPLHFRDRMPRRTTIAFSFALATLLSLAWLKDVVARTLAGDFGYPTGEAAIGHVVHALDLGLQVPLALAAGVLLLRRRPSGHLVAALLLVNAACMGCALTAMVAARALAAHESLLSAAPFAVVAFGSIALGIAYFAAIRPVSRPTTQLRWRFRFRAT